MLCKIDFCLIGRWSKYDFEPELNERLTSEGIDITQIINIETQGEYIRVWYRG